MKHRDMNKIVIMRACYVRDGYAGKFALKSPNTGKVLKFMGYFDGIHDEYALLLLKSKIMKKCQGKWENIHLSIGEVFLFMEAARACNEHYCPI